MTRRSSDSKPAAAAAPPPDPERERVRRAEAAGRQLSEEGFYVLDGEVTFCDARDAEGVTVQDLLFYGTAKKVRVIIVRDDAPERVHLKVLKAAQDFARWCRTAARERLKRQAQPALIEGGNG